MDSNHTLRFPRTAREAGIYGPVDFDDRDFWDKLVAWLVAMGIVFCIGTAFGMVIA